MKSNGQRKTLEVFKDLFLKPGLASTFLIGLNVRVIRRSQRRLQMLLPLRKKPKPSSIGSVSDPTVWL